MIKNIQARNLLFISLALIFFIPGFLRAQEIKNGSLFRLENDYKVYFLENGVKRWIENTESFNTLEFDWDKIKSVSWGLFSNYPEGKGLSKNNFFPEGMLFRKTGDYKVYTIENGRKRWVEDEFTFNNLRFDWESVMEFSNENFRRINEGKSINKQSAPTKPSVSITKYPDKVVEDYNIEFQFGAMAYKGALNQLVFETFLEGVNSGWKTISGNLSKIRLPQKNGDYNFFVRAILKDGRIASDPQKYSFSVVLSPYFGNLKIQQINARTSDPDLENIIIANTGKDTVDISGWSVEDKKHKAKYNISDVYEIPAHPHFNYKSPISLPPGGRITIYSGKSPLGGGFRLNKCSGYLNSSYDFKKQSLSRSCPVIQSDTEEIESLGDYCNKVISKTQRCSEPNYNDILLSNECREYLRESFGYAKCVEQNKDEYDFFSNEWRVYLKAQEDLWNDKRGTIVLRDQNGLAVSTYSY